LSSVQRRFFRRDPITLARALLGRTLVRRLESGAKLSGRIVETEAYLGIRDRAAHSFGGRRTKRNESMWLDGGHAYVYFTYGMHWLLNIVSESEGQPTACLIRALEPLEGLEEMRRNRAGKVSLHRLKDVDLCSGPAKLTEALRIDGAQDGLDLVDGKVLYLEPGRSVTRDRIVTTTRIGVAYARWWAKRRLRFYVRDNPNVSVRRARAATGR
jgi:DNA-3-methyladenine glycosylase